MKLLRQAVLDLPLGLSVGLQAALALTLVAQQ